MQKKLISLVLFLAVLNLSYGQLVQEWKQKDIDLLNQAIRLDKKNPAEIEKFFHSRVEEKEKEILGFGWSQLFQSIGAGYMSIQATFFYFRDTIKTYFLETHLSDEVKSLNEYTQLLAKFLPLDSAKNYSYRYQVENILRPIDEFKKTQISISLSATILKYMSPMTGTWYGFRGGIGGELLHNRKEFFAISRKLTNQQVIALMYSINPASRLTAIEYYLRNMKKFKASNSISKWIEQVYLEMPEVETMSGCDLYKDSAKRLVENYAKIKLQ